MYYLKNTNFWMFGLFFFFYFFIMGAYFPFFPIWLHDINHISKSDTGIIFAAISLFSLLFQPLFGLLSDKLGLRKYLLWIITGMLVMFAPFFIFIFGPLLQYNILVGSIVGGDWWRRLLEPVSIGGIPAERRSLPLPVGLVSKIIITGQAMSARISRKEIHYVLFKKHKLLDVRFILFLLLFYHGSLLPVFPDLAT